MGNDASKTLEQRAILRAAISCLAEPLQGASREAFIANAEREVNRAAPAPSRAQMRSYLKTSL
jgi:hypothetical protein